MQFCAVFEHFQAPYTSSKFEVISIFIACILASTDNYTIVVTEVAYRHLEVVESTLKKAHIFAVRTLKNERQIFYVVYMRAIE